MLLSVILPFHYIKGGGSVRTRLPTIVCGLSRLSYHNLGYLIAAFHDIDAAVNLNRLLGVGNRRATEHLAVCTVNVDVIAFKTADKDFSLAARNARKSINIVQTEREETELGAARSKERIAVGTAYTGIDKVADILVADCLVEERACLGCACFFIYLSEPWLE